jgi:cytochrome c oxidase assembly protein subunit 11
MNEETVTKPAVNERLPGAKPMNPKAKRYLIGLTMLVVGMFGFAYANAEFFVMVCRKVGLLAEEPNALRAEIVEGELGAPIDVYFSATTADNLPIVFTVNTRVQKGRVGQRLINDYRFVNTSNQTVYFKPIHDVFPIRAGAPDAMILEACFCFTHQKLEPFETRTMPVIYTFTDKIGETQVLRMSYSLHRSDKGSYEAAIKAYEAGLVDEAHRAAMAPGAGS